MQGQLEEAGVTRDLQNPVSAEALKTVVAVKHFYDYDMEGVRDSHPVTERHVANVNVSKRDQVEYFSPSFERAIRKGKPVSVMCSYTEVNGIAPCYNKAMITDQLRNKWNFSGFVVSASFHWNIHDQLPWHAMPAWQIGSSSIACSQCMLHRLSGERLQCT